MLLGAVAGVMPTPTRTALIEDGSLQIIIIQFFELVKRFFYIMHSCSDKKSGLFSLIRKDM